MTTKTEREVVRARGRRTTAGQLRFIADHLERRLHLTRFPVVLRAASRELYELRWYIGQLERKIARHAKRGRK